MTVWVGAADGSKKQLVDPYVGAPTGRVAAQKIWVGDATGTPRLVFQRALPVTLTASVAGWDQINLSWNNSGAGVSYALYRGSTVIYQGTALAFNDTVLMPSTGYSYRLDAIASGVVVHTSSTSATTSAYTVSLSAGAASYSQINLSWSDSAQRSVNRYLLYRWTGAWSAIYDGPNHSHADGGLGASTNYSYLLQAYRGSTPIGANSQTSATTSARPVSYGTAYGPAGWENYTGWTGSTQKYLTGPNIAVGVGGTFTNMTLLVYGHGQAFRGEPKINGVAGAQQVYNVGRTHTDWPFNLGFGAGTFTTGITVGGSGWGAAEWSPWAGQVWNNFVHTHRLDYWYYASAEERLVELRALPWWRSEFEGLATYLETWSNDTGDGFVRAKLTDLGSGEVLVEWEQ